MLNYEWIVTEWRGGKISKKQKTKILKAYMIRFQIGKATADATLNGRRTTATEPEEVEFLVPKINEALKFLKTAIS